MNPLTCADVDAHIELFAAGECDEPMTTAIRAHLAHCASCADSYQEARVLVGLLDIRSQESERLEHLRQRLAAEDVSPIRSKARILPLLRRVGSVAAMLLVVIGLFLWLRPGRFTDKNNRKSTDLATLHPKDFSLWSMTVISTVQEKRSVQAVPAPGLERRRGATIVWAAPGTKWQIQPGLRIELTAGELFVRKQPTTNDQEPLEIHATTAVVQSSNGAFFINLHKPRPSQRGKRPLARRAIKPLVDVTVLRGRVRLRTSSAAVTGTRGEVLTAAPDSAPHKRVVPSSQLPTPPR
jgi:hypothetical protein